VALIIKDRIAANVINFQNVANTEVIGVKIPAGNAEMAIVSVYVPPSRGRYKELKSVIERLGQFFIAAGDFNAHSETWGGRKTNLTGQYLEKLITHLDCRVHLPPSCTRIHPSNPSRDAALDICLTHTTLTDVTIRVLEEGSSDHKPILITLPENLTLFNPLNVRLKTNWDGIAEDLDKVSWPKAVEPHEAGIEIAIKTLTSNIQVAMLNNTKGVKVNNRYQHLIPRAILKLIKHKQKIKHRFPKHRKPNLRLKLKQISRKIRKELNRWELERKTEKIKEIDDQNKRWKILRDWTPKPPMIPTLRENGKFYFSNREKADVLAQSLYNKFAEHRHDSRHSIEETVAKFQIPDIDPNVPEITPSQVSEAIDEGNSNKSPGYDGICYKVLKLLNIEAINYITSIYNAITKLQYFPDALKHGIIIILPKEGKPPDSPASYRPITLLPTLGKVYEQCVLSFLQRIEKELHIIPHEQHGFRASHSTGTQLARVLETLIRNYNHGKYTVMVALDIEAAFDKVPHKYLLYKLSQFRFPDWTIRLLWSYFTNRTSRVKVENELSAPFQLRAGVPQGGLLSPFLYNLYTADIPLHTCHTTTALYADDTLLVTASESPILAEINSNLALAELEAWLKKWKIRVNGGKSKASFIAQKSKTFKPRIFVSGELINLSEEIKYLGVLFDNQLTWSAQVKATLKTAKQRTAALLSQIRDLPATKETKTLLYMTYIRPLLTYGISAWGGVSNKTLDPY